MVADRISNLFDTFVCSYQKMFGFLQADLLYIRGIGKSRLAFDQTVEIIFLIVEFIYQILNRNVLVMCPDIIGNLFEYDPVHGLLLLFGKREIILCT